MGLLGGALVAELALRVYARVHGPFAARIGEFDPLGVQVEPFGTLGYRQRPHARLRYPNGTVATANSLGYRGPEISRAKPAGVVRVVLLGGSTTHGWWVNDDQTIDAYMRRMLSTRSGQRFEVINAALDGYDSRQQLERLRYDLLRLEPDIIIVNSGINDVRNARFPNLVDDDRRTLIWEGPMQRLRDQERYGVSWEDIAKHHSFLLRLPSFVLNRARGSSTPDTTPTPNPQAAEYFERNLRRIGQIAARHSIKLIFSTPPSSLRTRHAPTARSDRHYWIRDAETTQQYRDTLAARMQKVAKDLSREMSATYLKPQVPPDQFLDDCHLTSQGNATVAGALVDAVLRLMTP